MPDLTPVLYEAVRVAKSTWLSCGQCGFNGEVTHYIFTDAPWCYEPLCNCPLPTILLA